MSEVKHTPLPWRRVALGGSSTVLSAAEPSRNDNRIPAYGYDPVWGYCIAYPFLDDDNTARLDFVSFSHGDAELIVNAVNSHATLAAKLAAAEARISELEGENERLHGRTLELQTHAWKWMEAHDCLKSGRSYDFPRPADLPDALAEIERLRAALETAGEWQEISTAPKNTKLLAAYQNELGNWRIVTACYHTHLDWSDEYGDHEQEFAPEAWYEESDSSEVIYPTSCVPTRWMPLPAFPALASRRGA